MLIKIPTSVAPNADNFGSLTGIGSTLYFNATDGSSGVELWKSDGTSAGTMRVADILPGAGSSRPTHFTAFGGSVYFGTEARAAGGRLWRTDGTSAGTIRVSDITGFNPSDIGGALAAIGNTLYFPGADDSGSSGIELWKTDGTSAGTMRVADLFPGGIGNSSAPRYLTVIGDTLYFNAFNPSSGPELWKSDGTEAGTVPITSSGLNPRFITAVGNILYFSASGVGGQELWKSDGTSAGTVRVADINPGSLSSNPGADAFSAGQGFAVIGNTVYFGANDGSTGTELWKSDGTSAGTVRVADINPGPATSSPLFLTAIGNTLYFRAFRLDGNGNGNQLWKSDGTSAGTVPVTNAGILRNPEYLTSIGNTLYFRATERGGPNELWALTEGALSPAPVSAPSDPTSPILAIAPLKAKKKEGNRRFTGFSFSVSRSGDLSQASSVNWSAKGIGPKSRRANKADFGKRFPSGTVTFAEGESSKTISIKVQGDRLIEPNEKFSVTLKSPINASIGIAKADGVIRNDDGRKRRRLAALAAKPSIERRDSQGWSNELFGAEGMASGWLL